MVECPIGIKREDGGTNIDFGSRRKRAAEPRCPRARTGLLLSNCGATAWARVQPDGAGHPNIPRQQWPFEFCKARMLPMRTAARLQASKSAWASCIACARHQEQRAFLVDACCRPRGDVLEPGGVYLRAMPIGSWRWQRWQAAVRDDPAQRVWGRAQRQVQERHGVRALGRHHDRSYAVALAMLAFGIWGSEEEAAFGDRRRSRHENIFSYTRCS